MFNPNRPSSSIGNQSVAVPDWVAERVIRVNSEKIDPREYPINRQTLADATTAAHGYVSERLKVDQDYIKPDECNECSSMAFANISLMYSRIRSGEGVKNVPDSYRDRFDEAEKQAREALESFNGSKGDSPTNIHAIKSLLQKDSVPSYAAERVSYLLKSANAVFEDVLYNPAVEIDSRIVNDIATNTRSMIVREKQQIEASERGE